MKRYQGTLRFAIVVHDDGTIGPKELLFWELHTETPRSIKALLQHVLG